MHIERIERIDPGLRAGLGQLLIDGVHGGASIGFLAPLPAADADAYWQGVDGELGPGLWLWVAREGDQVLGSVQLALCGKANGRHRGEIQKLMVHSSQRGRGLARQLMQVAEQAARADGRRLLVLDTQAGSAADAVYPRLGWQRAGEIPGYAAQPDGQLRATVYYYKPL